MTTAVHQASSVRYSNRRYFENTATGEKFDFIKTPADTNGAYAEVIITVPAGFNAIPAHAHPQQSEQFTVITGKIGVKNNGETYILGPGESIISDAGSVHSWWNAGDTELRFNGKVVPAMHFSELIGTIYDSANARNSTEPSLLDAIYVLMKYRDEYDPVFLPKPVQMVGFPVLYALGKLTGRHRVMEEYIAGHYD
jgi:quercetin dioxygenase-like cupin family protein